MKQVDSLLQPMGCLRHCHREKLQIYTWGCVYLITIHLHHCCHLVFIHRLSCLNGSYNHWLLPGRNEVVVKAGQNCFRSRLMIPFHRCTIPCLNPIPWIHLRICHNNQLHCFCQIHSLPITTHIYPVISFVQPVKFSVWWQKKQSYTSNLVSK